MCRRAVCRSCRKVTYEGCGRHVEEVLDGVPAQERCTCETAARARTDAGEPVTATVPPPSRAKASRAKAGRWARVKAWMKSPA